MTTSVPFEGVSEARLGRIAQASLETPGVFPAVTDLTITRDGAAAWIRREENGESVITWELVDRQGRVRATVLLPIGLDLYEATQREAWGVLKDEYDVPQIVRVEFVAR